MFRKIDDDQWVAIVSVACIVFMIATMGGFFYTFYRVFEMFKEEIMGVYSPQMDYVLFVKASIETPKQSGNTCWKYWPGCRIRESSLTAVIPHLETQILPRRFSRIL